MNTRLSLCLIFGAVIFLAACDKDDDSGMTEPTLYEKLGGTALVADPNSTGMIEKGRLGLRSVVDSTIFVIAADPKLSPYFATLLSEVGNGNVSNLAILSENLTDFFCVATGAEHFTYDGLDMASAHDPSTNPRMAQKADNAAYDAFINDVVIGAQQNNVPSELITEVGAFLETLRETVVQR
ncbi:MAG: group 1 truncated hemoglobin [Lewinellaceae bacterium]|nr:group 1 truncated hemoglobin [Lewinellaceae bacterium]